MHYSNKDSVPYIPFSKGTGENVKRDNIMTELTYDPTRAYQSDGSYVHNVCNGGIAIHVPATVDLESLPSSRVTRYESEYGRKMVIVRYRATREEEEEILYTVFDYTYGRGKEFYTKKWRYTYDRSTKFEIMDGYLTKTLMMRRVKDFTTPIEASNPTGIKIQLLDELYALEACGMSGNWEENIVGKLVSAGFDVISPELKNADTLKTAAKILIPNYHELDEDTADDMIEALDIENILYDIMYEINNTIEGEPSNRIGKQYVELAMRMA